MKKINIKKSFTFFVALLPFLYQYKSPISVISLGEFILIPFLIYFILMESKRKIKLSYFNGMYTYWLIVLVMTVFASIQPHFSFESAFTVFIRIIYYSFLIYVSYKNFNVEYALNVVTFFSVFFSIYAVIQFSMYHINRTILPTVINASWVFEAERGIRLDYANYYRWIYRPSSLFLEPSYFATFCSVGLTYSVFLANKSMKMFCNALIITFGLVISASSAGLFILILNWFGYFYNICFKFKNKINVKTIFITLVFIVFAIYIFKSSVSDTLLARTASGGSFNQRITRTFLISKYMNVYQQIVGIGLNNLENYVKYNGINTKYDEGEKMLNYASSMIGTYVCSGFITLIFYIRFYFKSWFSQYNDYFSRLILVTLLFFSFIEMNSYTYRFAFLVIFLFAKQRDNLSSITGGDNE